MWYDDYDNLKEELIQLRVAFSNRCADLKVQENSIINQFSREFIVRSVHESNWQEGIHIEAGKTQKFSEMAFENLEEFRGPGIDINGMLQSHAREVAKLFQKGASQDEVGAYNLAAAHVGAGFLAVDLGSKEAAALAQVMQKAVELLKTLPDDETTRMHIERGENLLSSLLKEESLTGLPLRGGDISNGDFTRELLKLDPKTLSSPLTATHLHFLHRLVMMGMLSPEKCGVFRKCSVNVGNPDLYFPVPAAIGGLIEEMCLHFPSSLGLGADPVLSAAKASHRFVAIHPYEDGNGRVSRIIMNMILGHTFPTVYLKADKKGRARYGQALRRADRGKIEPLASLITKSLIEMYQKMLNSIKGS